MTVVSSIARRLPEGAALLRLGDRAHAKGLHRVVRALGLEHAPGSWTLRPIRDVVRETLGRIENTDMRGRRIAGIATGFERWDRLTGGLHDGELTIVAARPEMGKTSLVLDIACNVASPPRRESTPDPREPWDGPACGVLVVSRGEPQGRAAHRMLLHLALTGRACAEARVGAVRERARALGPLDRVVLTEDARRLADLGIWVEDEPELSAFDIRARAMRLRAEIEPFYPEDGERTHPLGLIVIDGIRRVRGMRRLLRRLRAIARELMVPIIATLTLDPSSGDEGDGGRPQLSDLLLGADDADSVCFVHRGGYYVASGAMTAVFDRDADRLSAELIVASQRNGPADIVRLRWEPVVGHFDNLPEGEDDGPA
jgi:replicative DNA helicase